MLALLALVLPLLLAVATQYTIQVVPDFDDYDWDGPDDDSRDEKKAHAIWTAPDSHVPGTASVDVSARSVHGFGHLRSCQARVDDHHLQLISLPHRNPALFRGPPRRTIGSGSAARNGSGTF